MNSADLATFNSAVDAAQLGQTEAAYNALNDLSRSYPSDPNVLLWMAFTCGNTATSRQLIEKVASLDPSNTSLPAARNWLATQQPTPQPQPAQVPYPAFSSQSVQTEYATPHSAPQPDSAYNVVQSERQSGQIAPPSQSLPSDEKSDPADPQVDLRKAMQASPPSRFSLKVSPLLVMGVVAVLIVIIFLAISLPAILSTNIGDIPSPPNGQSIDLSTKDKTSLLAGQNLPKDIQFGAFVVSNAKTADLSSFYTRSMTGSGWNTQGLINSGPVSIHTYTKGDKGVIILIVGPLTASQLNVGTSDSLRAKVKAGDTVVVLVEGNSKDLKLTPSA